MAPASSKARPEPRHLSADGDLDTSSSTLQNREVRVNAGAPPAGSLLSTSDPDARRRDARSLVLTSQFKERFEEVSKEKASLAQDLQRAEEQVRAAS